MKVNNHDEMVSQFREEADKQLEYGSSKYGNESWQKLDEHYFITKIKADLKSYEEGNRSPVLLVNCANRLMMAWALRINET